MKRPFLSALLLLAVALPVAAQYKDTEDTPKDAVIKRDETVKPEGRYANMPDEAVPYRRFTKPYYDWFVREDTLQYNGAADLRPDGDRRPTERNRHRLLQPRREQSRDGFRHSGAPRRATGHRTSQRARRIQRQALRAQNSQRIGSVGSVFRRARQNAFQRKLLGHGRVHRWPELPHLAARNA